MADPSKTGIDKTPNMSGGGAKIASPMKPYKVKGGGGKSR